METTALYVELIVIGLETMMWILSFSAYFIGIGQGDIQLVANAFEKLPVSLIMLGIMYVTGIIFDRIADSVFQKFEDKIRKKSGLQAKSTILIWKKSGQESYYNFTRSKLRILRSSVLNIPLIAISVCLYTNQFYGSHHLFFCFCVFIGVLFSIATASGYWKLLKSYYNKAKILEDSL